MPVYDAMRLQLRHRGIMTPFVPVMSYPGLQWRPATRILRVAMMIMMRRLGDDPGPAPLTRSHASA
jgi:hypothetical protein